MPKDVRKLKDRAAELMAKRRFERAAEAYRELCGLEPRDLSLHQKLADALRAGGEREEAARIYQSVADRFAREGLLLKAIAVNKIILDLDPTHTATQATLASLYALRQGRVGGSSPREAPRAVGENEGAAQPPPVRSEADLPTPELDLDLEAEMAQLVAPSVGGPRASPPAAAPRLPETPLFSDLEPSAFIQLLTRCALRRYEAGELVVRQGDPGSSFFVLGSGSVRVFRRGETGEVVELARLAEGAFFGEMALLSDAPRSASVEAAEQVEILEFPAAVLRELVTEQPSAKRAVDRFTRSRLLSSIMATSPLFRPFDFENRRLLIERFRVREVGVGEVVLRQGAEGDGLYVLMQGRLEVRRREGEDGGGLLLSELREGDVFGEMSLLTRSPASADVIAKAQSRVLRLPRQVFEEVILTHPQILELVARLSEERAKTNDALLGGTIACDTEGLILL